MKSPIERNIADIRLRNDGNYAMADMFCPTVNLANVRSSIMSTLANILPAQVRVCVPGTLGDLSERTRSTL